MREKNEPGKNGNTINKKQARQQDLFEGLRVERKKEKKRKRKKIFYSVDIYDIPNKFGFSHVETITYLGRRWSVGNWKR